MTIATLPIVRPGTPDPYISVATKSQMYDQASLARLVHINYIADTVNQIISALGGSALVGMSTSVTSPGLTGTQTLVGMSATALAKSNDANGTSISAYNAVMTGVAVGRADIAAYAGLVNGTLSTAYTAQGLFLNIANTMTSAGATTYGARITNATMTHTDGTYYGVYVKQSATVTAGTAYGIFVDSNLFNANTKAIKVNTTTAIATATLMTSVNITQIMTGASAINMAEANRTTLQTAVQLGNWANAIVGKIDFTTTGYVTGLAGVFCAELDMPSTAVPGGHGTYTCYEAEINMASASAVPISVMAINIWGANATTFDTSGYIMDINGLTSGATSCFYSHNGTAGGDTTNAWLKIRVNGTPYWIGLYSATH